MNTNLILVRHAECQGNIENRLSGITDFKLTKNGKEQLKPLGLELKNEKIDVIYSSPLRRAMETARAIAKYSNIKNIHMEHNLKEINYGVCDGVEWKEINERYPQIYKMWKEIYNYPVNIPLQEEYSEVQKRMINSIKKICTYNDGKNICIVSHGIAIQAFLCYYFKKDISKANEIPQLKNAKYIKIPMN